MSGKLDDPWDLPPRPIKGDAPIEALYFKIARALCKWEELEAQLMYLYGVLSGKPANNRLSFADYSNLKSLPGRLELTNAAAERFFVQHPNQQFEGEFLDLLIKIRRFKDRRNDIAHGIPIILRNSLNNENLPVEMFHEWCLGPSMYSINKFDENDYGVYLLSGDQIDYFTGQFNDLLFAIYFFRDKINAIVQSID